MTAARLVFLVLLVAPIAAGCADRPGTGVGPATHGRAQAEGSTAADGPPGTGRTLVEAGVVPSRLGDLVAHRGDARVSVARCPVGTTCETVHVALEDDGSYRGRGFVGVGGSLGELMVVCDEGWWTEAPGEITLTSCGGATYQADWRVVSSQRLQLGDFEMTLSAARVWDTRCERICDPFWE